MTWVARGGVLIWDGDPGELDQAAEPEESAYRWTAVPIEDRPHPSCGKPGTGRTQHNKLGEPMCSICAAAEAAYTAYRRDTGRL